MNRKLMLMLALTVLCAAVAAQAAEERMKVMAFTDDDETELKVEVNEKDGVAHVKVFRIVDGEEVLVEEYEGEDAPRHVEVDGQRILVLGDDDHHVWTHGDGDHDVFVQRFHDGDFAWTVHEDGAWLGVQLEDLDDAKAEYFDVKDGEGALVSEVVEDSPAAAAGLEIYDVILKVGDDAVKDAGDVVELIGDREAGDEVELRVLRKGKKKTVKVELGERPANDFAFASPRLHKNMRFFPGSDMERLHEKLAPMSGLRSKELENLRADVEELRAMIEELKNNR